MTQNNLGNALSSLGERESGTARAGGGGRGLSGGAGGMHPRARAARLGHDPEQPRQCALERWASARAGTARLEEAVAAYRAALEDCTRERVPLALGHDPEQPRQCAPEPGRARERHRAAGGGGRGLSGGPGGTHPRARAAGLGHDPEQPRQRAPRAWASARAGTARLEEAVAAYRGPSRNAPASACRSTGP